MNDLLLKLYVRCQQFLDGDEGQDLVEYALLSALIALAAIAGIKSIGTNVSTQFSKIAASV